MNISDGLLVAGQKALDLRSTKIVNNKSVPFTTVAEAKTEVPSSKRHVGLIVNVNGVLYWWKAGILDADLVKLDTRPYKTYVAVITQAGSGAPGVDILENTLGGTLVWARSSTGVYTATLAGAFVAGKTALYVSKATQTFGQFTYTSTNVVTLSNYSTSNALIDGMTGDTVEIRVYN